MGYSRAGILIRKGIDPRGEHTQRRGRVWTQ